MNLARETFTNMHNGWKPSKERVIAKPILEMDVGLIVPVLEEGTHVVCGPFLSVLYWSQDCIAGAYGQGG